MTSDERVLLLLLAKMVLSGTRRGPDEKELRAAIARIENAESKQRDEFVGKFLKLADGYHNPDFNSPYLWSSRSE